MPSDIITVAIPKLLSEWTGAIISRSRVIDGLLDLRSAAGADREIVGVIDEALTTMPGQNQVEVSWAVEVLARISDLAARSTLVR